MQTAANCVQSETVRLSPRADLHSSTYSRESYEKSRDGSGPRTPMKTAHSSQLQYLVSIESNFWMNRADYVRLYGVQYCQHKQIEAMRLQTLHRDLRIAYNSGVLSVGIFQ